jgi:hypothetical protein
VIEILNNQVYDHSKVEGWVDKINSLVLKKLQNLKAPLKFIGMIV